MEYSVVLLPGDGIGPEIIRQGRRVMEAVAGCLGAQLHLTEGRIGGAAMDATGDPLPADTLSQCRDADAILLGAVGGPQWDNPTAKKRPEQGLLAIRRELGLFANLRPISTFPELVDASPLKREVVEGVDILFVRELTGGIYFGDSGRRPHPSGTEAWNEMRYSTGEIERIVHVAGKVARERGGHLTSVDKANVLEVSRLWREVAQGVVATDYPDLNYDVELVDAMAMHLISRPRDFDVVVTGNLFGDILTDAASMLPGSLGLLPSASLGDGGPGLFEPIHGSAPDIAGQGVANPLATILAVAMLWRHSLGQPQGAELIESAVQRVLAAGHRTRDIAAGGPAVSTEEMGTLVLEALSAGTAPGH